MKNRGDFMKTYTITLDDLTQEFYEGVAIATNRPVEDILADACFKLFENIFRNIDIEEWKEEVKIIN